MPHKPPENRLQHAANDVICYLLTPQERDAAAIASLHLERHRRATNARDKAAQDAADRGNDARLGIVWPDDAA